MMLCPSRAERIRRCSGAGPCRRQQGSGERWLGGNKGTEAQKSKPLEMKGPAKVGEVGGRGLGEMEVREGEGEVGR